MRESTLARLAPWVNLLLPGGGLILADAVAAGLVVGALFAACINLAAVTVLLFPDDFSHMTRMLIFGVTGGTYVGIQIRLMQTLRRRRTLTASARRREALREAQELVSAGQPGEGLQRLRVLAQRYPDDLHVAFRLAQLLTVTGNKTAALTAWQRVRALDRHGIYRPLAVEHERRLGEGSAK